MNALKWIAVFVVAALVGSSGFIWFGVYNLAATAQHLAPTYVLLDLAMRRAVHARSADIAVPPLDDPALIQQGLGLYREHCVQCHGAPGVAPEPFALGLLPAAANLAFTAREWPPAELFWVVKHGLKMTGMPAWVFRMSEAEMWAVVAFMRQMSWLSPQQYQAMETQHRAPVAEPLIGLPDPARGKRAIDQYACITCHEMPDVIGGNAPVGPPLGGIGSRTFIAGVLPNNTENMIRWLREPQAVDPRSAMPDLGISERDARDMAAYLATLK